MIDQYSVFGPPSGKPQKPTAQMQRVVTAACEPLILHLKKQVSPIPEEQFGNHLKDFHGKWYRNQYYIYMTFKCPPNSLQETFDSGFARLGWTGGDTFLLYSYMAHRNKWEAFYENIPLAEAIIRIKESDFFSF